MLAVNPGGVTPYAAFNCSTDSNATGAPLVLEFQGQPARSWPISGLPSLSVTCAFTVYAYNATGLLLADAPRMPDAVGAIDRCLLRVVNTYPVPVAVSGWTTLCYKCLLPLLNASQPTIGQGQVLAGDEMGYVVEYCGG